jgi:hypothetical protein
MPYDRDDGHDIRGVVSHRRQLIAGTAGVDLALGAEAVRFSNVPLFKERDGRLHQAVRVRVPANLPAGVTARLTGNGQAGDTVSLESTPRPHSIYLLTPEVDATTSATVEVLQNGAVAASAEFSIEPQRKWTVHLVHHSHYDIGYTDTQSTVLESQLSFIDLALELCTVTDDWDDAAKFRWNIEVNWPLKQWLKTRPKAAREALKRRIAEGRIEVNALPFSMHTEAYSFDELAKQLAFTDELRREHGVDIVSAIQSDVPGATIGLSTLLTDAGIKYFTVAHNYAGRSIPFLNDGQQLTRPFYWQAPDGEKVLVWYTDSLMGIAYMEAMVLGFGGDYDDVLGSLPEYLNALQQRSYPYGDSEDWLSVNLSGVELTKQPYEFDVLHLRVQGAFADNASASLVPSEIAKAWNAEWSYPRLRTSIGRDFFAEIEEKYGNRLQTYSGDWTDWWADGIGSAAIALGTNRQSQNDIRVAQSLNALADLLTDEPNPAIAAETTAAYENLALFDEHTWGAANPWESGAIAFATGQHEWVRKEAFAYTGAEQVTMLLNGGLQRIGALGASSAAGVDAQTLLVFNPSSWSRSGLVRVFIPERSLNQPELRLIDLAGGEEAPYLIEPQTNPNHRPRGYFIRFFARNLPAFGYARYALVPGAATAHASESNDPTTISNSALTATIDLATASVRSLIETATNREIAGGGPFGLNAYIYDRYATGLNFNHLSGRIGSAGPWMLGSRKAGEYGHITHRESNAVWDRVTVRFSGDGAEWAETTYTLPHGASRLLIENRLHKPATMVKESLYFAFPLAVEQAKVSFEITGGIASDDRPHVPGSADWFRAIRHWATVESEGAAPIAWATGEAPLLQTGNIRIPYAPFPNSIPAWQQHDATIFSWALNNLWDTNFPPQQGGEMVFRYAVGVGGDDALALGRETGAAVAHPLIGVATPLDSTPVDGFADRGSFVTVDSPLVEVSHLAPARDGGVAVFLYSLAAEPIETRVDITGLPFSSALAGTFLEANLEPAQIDGQSVRVTIEAGELKVLVLR